MNELNSTSNFIEIKITRIKEKIEFKLRIYYYLIMIQLILKMI